MNGLPSMFDLHMHTQYVIFFRNDLWILADEVFATSVDIFTAGESFTSTLAFRSQSESVRRRLVWMWSPSKDLCLPGLRLAVIHTEDVNLQKALRRLEIMQPCAPMVQAVVAQLLSDSRMLTALKIVCY